MTLSALIAVILAILDVIGGLTVISFLILTAHVIACRACRPGQPEHEAAYDWDQAYIRNFGSRT